MDKSSLKIRYADKDDISDIAGLHLLTLEELAGIAPAGYGDSLKHCLPTAEEFEKLFTSELEDERSVLVIAEIDGILAGFAFGFLEKHSDDLIEAPYLSIVYLETAKEFRKRGVGRALLKEMERLARERGIKTIDLQVWLTNKPAMRLSVEAGYQPLEMRMGKRV